MRGGRTECIRGLGLGLPVQRLRKGAIHHSTRPKGGRRTAAIVARHHGGLLLTGGAGQLTRWNAVKRVELIVLLLLLLLWM